MVNLYLSWWSTSNWESGGTRVTTLYGKSTSIHWCQCWRCIRIIKHLQVGVVRAYPSYLGASFAQEWSVASSPCFRCSPCCGGSACGKAAGHSYHWPNERILVTLHHQRPSNDDPRKESGDVSKLFVHIKEFRRSATKIIFRFTV